MTFHARLSPSGADRWMTCTSSVELEALYEDKSSTFADEGTVAHALAEQCLTNEQSASDYIDQVFKTKASDGRPLELAIDASIADYVDMYVEYVRDVLHSNDYITHWIEERVYYDDYVPEGSGTADCIAAYREDDHKVLHVIDLKFGRGVAVDAENNRQGMLYALGSYLTHNWQLELASTDIIRITIHQPRIGDGFPSTWDITVAELLAFADDAKTAAQKIEDGDTQTVVSEKGCMFCKHRNHCEPRAQELLRLTDLELDDETLSGTLPEVEDMTNDQIAAIVARSQEIKKFLNSIEDMALQTAATGRETYAGLKLVEGISRRRWSDENDVVDVLEKVLGVEDAWATKLITPSEADKRLKKAGASRDDAAAVRAFIVKPQGKLALVPEVDKRPAVDLAEYNGLEDES